MDNTSLAKATIINLDTKESIACMFNPKEYAFAKRNSWTRGDTAGSNMPQLEFGSGEPATLQLQLFFDTYADRQDVRKRYTEAIWNLMLVDQALQDPKSMKARPPKVRFQWGASWSFDAVITSISQKFTLFLSDGTPVRATLDVSLEQIQDDKLFPKQNPTSGGSGGERLWTVNDGDTLAWIAYKEYGDPKRWRLIADANRLTCVRRLAPGMVLVIPHG
ncbi:MAG TPA: LysM peptidoglycan-binding domain-containing protein [Roseiflexaceae bacterium]